MPTRLIRDWTRSERVNNLSIHAERFFVRLIMKVDDYGCYYADPRILKADLFPLLDSVRSTDIPRWMAECQKSGLIATYEHEGKKYLQIKDFGQRMRLKTRKFPPCQADDGQMTGICQTHDGHVTGRCPPEVEVEVEVEKEVERERAFAPPERDEVFSLMSEKLDTYQANQEADKFMNYYESNGWKVGKNKMKKWRAAVAGWISRLPDYGKKPELSVDELKRMARELDEQS